MNYSREWQDKLNLHNGLPQVLDWKTAIAEKYVDLNNSKATNLIFLNNPVWIEIHEMCGRDPFRKIKAVSKYNVYFDGTYKDLSDSFALGRIHGWDYTIDGHTLDLNRARLQDDNQEKLIDFIKEYSDGFYKPVPKGILKIPTELMNKTVTLSKEEITTLNKIKDYLTEDEINRFFPKFKDILIKVNNG